MAGGIDWRIEEKDTGRILTRLDQFPEALRGKLRAVIRQLTNELLVKVEAAEPSRTGRLRQQTMAFVDSGIGKSGNWVRGRVRVLRDEGRSNYGRIAGALEYGAPGRRRAGRKVAVSAHSRGSTTVGAYQRAPPRIRAMRFLRGPAAAHQPRARAMIRAAIGDLLRETKL